MSDPLAGPGLAGLLLAGGGLVLVLLVGPTTFVPPALWTGPREVSLRLIAAHARIWRAANAGFAIATVLTAAGLACVPGLVGTRGTSLALAAAVMFALASVPWLVMLGIRLSITPRVAAEFAATGALDPTFPPIDRLGGALFPVFLLVASGSIVALGAAIVAGGSLSPILGGACIAAGLAIGGGYLVFGDMLPAFVYFPTAAVGIALLLGWT